MKKVKDSIAEQLKNAQLTIVEQAFIAWLEEVEGRVPSDTEIQELGFWVQFAATPLGCFEKDGNRWNQFYVWRRKHVVAAQFLNPDDLLKLYVVRIPEDEWPVALKLYIAQLDEKREKGAE